MPYGVHTDQVSRVGKHRGASGVQNLAARIHEADGHIRAADSNAQYEFAGTSVADAICNDEYPCGESRGLDNTKAPD